MITNSKGLGPSLTPSPFLDRSFFNRPTLEVAEDLIGKTFVWKEYQGIITETEAYIGQQDPACHAARGLTPRTAVMFGPAGFSYIYLIYGLYHCLNIVTEEEGFPAAVLIRGLNLFLPDKKHLDGPGKICRTLEITRAHNNQDFTESSFCGIQKNEYLLEINRTPRIGISKGQEKLWRFIGSLSNS